MLKVLDRKDVGQADWEEIYTLSRSIWPRRDPKLSRNEEIQSFLESEIPLFEKHIVLRDESGSLVGHVRCYSRNVLVDGIETRNMALAGVCVPPDARGHGHGRRVVEEAFRQFDKGNFECSFFQTAVPGFYVKLGAKVLDATTVFINSRNNGAYPWWDTHTMVYPGSFDAEGKTIDLLGPGY